MRDIRVLTVFIPWVALLLFLSSLGGLFAPLFLALLLHYATRPLLSFLGRWLPEKILYAAMSVLIGAVLLAIVFVLLPVLVGQLQLLLKFLPKALRQGLTYGEQLIAEHHFYTLAPPAQWQSWVDQWTGGMNHVASESIAFLAGSLRSVLASVAAMGMVPVFYYVMGCYQQEGVALMLAPLPRVWQSSLRACLEDVDASLSRYVFGQMAVVVVLMCLYTIGFAWLSLPFAGVLGCVSGLMVMIPVLGHMMGFTLAALVAWVQLSDSYFSYLVLFYGSVVAFEGTCLSPWFLGRAMGLPNAVVLILMALAQEWFGIWGVLLTAPSAMVLRVLILRVYRGYQSSHFYQSARWPGKSTSRE